MSLYLTLLTVRDDDDEKPLETIPMMPGVAVAPGVNQVIVFPSDSFVVKGFLERSACVCVCVCVCVYVCVCECVCMHAFTPQAP